MTLEIDVGEKEEDVLHAETEYSLENDCFYNQILEEDEMFDLELDKEFYWNEMSYYKERTPWI